MPEQDNMNAAPKHIQDALDEPSDASAHQKELKKMECRLGQLQMEHGVAHINQKTKKQTVDALKRAYKFAMGDMDIGQEEMIDELCDVLCGLIGDDAFCKFLEEEVK